MINRTLKILFCAALMMGAACSARAQTVASEYQVKAAFLFNFLKFVEWPAHVMGGSNEPYVIGVLGHDPFFNAAGSSNYLAQAVADKVINDRRIEVKKLDRSEPGAWTACHLLFISESEKPRVSEILRSVGDAPVLTVSEIEGFCAEGGLINFVLREDKVRFEINPRSAAAAGLRISSKLLNVATLIRSQPR